MDPILQKQLKNVSQGIDWGLVAAFQAYVVEKWNERELKGESEYETVCNVVERDAKIAGLKEFLEALEKIGYDN